VSASIGANPHPYLFSYAPGSLIHRLQEMVTVPIEGQPGKIGREYITVCHRRFSDWWDRSNVRGHRGHALCKGCFPR